eukprot:CAMPEP_0167792520 /NCGR_PEP_ID=MMETSP0111_2-20121227/12608_1 /TAXON_ID=91324 /ORGANISM="Lotharella globosa, Strain CCCM811" /LENGTH=156 /DNA_ID=CAMNT_0007685451 /DNA_START=365 /DNA_END=832 /DNA_ORIENTATION=-
MDQNQPQYGEDAEEEYALQQHDVLGQVRLVLPPVLLRVLLKLISGSSGRLSSLLRIAAADADVDVDVDAFPLEFLVVSFAFSSSTTAAATTELPEAAARSAIIFIVAMSLSTPITSRSCAQRPSVGARLAREHTISSVACIYLGRGGTGVGWAVGG